MKNDNPFIDYDTENNSSSKLEEHTWAPLKIDLKEYSEDLKEFDLTEEQKIELLETLCSIMRSFVDIGWGLDSVQLFSVSDDEFSSPDSGNTIEQKDSKNSFNNAVTNHAAKEVSHE